MIVVRCPYVPQRSLKNAKRPISIKNALRLKKVCYKVFLCENCQLQSCKAFIGLTNCAKIIGGGATLSTWNFGPKWPRWNEIADFQSIFARRALAVTPSDKSSISTNRRSTTRFPMSSRWTSYVVPTPQTVARKRTLSEICSISCNNSETVRDRMSVTINH